MGPFFYLKKEIPAKPITLKNFNLLIFLFVIPPRHTIFTLVNLLNNLNLLIPKKFLFTLNKEDKKMTLTFCNSLILISLRLCADPISSKFLWNE